MVGVACLLLLKQPDMGTALVICFAIGTLLIAAGVPMRNLGLIAGTLAFLALILALAEPYRRERLTAFLDPFADAGDTGFQAVQALTAIGSGGFFGVGLGESVQKIFYLPEAHTDMILAIIGEELGLFGLFGVVALYALIAYAGLRAAKMARDLYSKLVAAGLTSLILCQATLNFFAVLGHGAADRRAAAVPVLRRHEPGPDAGRDGPAAERGRDRRPGRPQRQATAAARDRRRRPSRSRASPARRSARRAGRRIGGGEARPPSGALRRVRGAADAVEDRCPRS